VVCTGLYVFLLGSSLPESAAALSPMVHLNAEVGTLYLEQGILKVAVAGIYDDDKLSVEIALHLEGRQKCSGSELERTCSSTFHGESYEDLSEALRAIDAAASALNSGTALKRRFRMDAAPGCNPSWSEVIVAPHGTLAEFALGEGASSYSISTDVDQLVAFRSALQRASDLRFLVWLTWRQTNTKAFHTSLANGSTFSSAAMLIGNITQKTIVLTGFTDPEKNAAVEQTELRAPNVKFALSDLRNRVSAGAVRPYQVRDIAGGFELVVT
jgi:hypothetical protein